MNNTGNVPQSASEKTTEPARPSALRSGMANWLNPSLWVLILLVIVLAFLPAITGRQYLREQLFTILFYSVLASSLNIIMGFTGYVSFGHVVFYGLGGYMGLFLLNRFSVSIWIAMLAGGLIAALLAFGLGKAILRLRGAYFALATIGINEAMRAFVSNFEPFGAATGISLKFSVYNAYGGAAKALALSYYILIGLLIFSILLSYYIKNSKFGLGLFAIREDEDAAEVMGVTAPDAKTWAYVLSAFIPGMVGVLFFFKNGNVEPAEAFRLNISIETIVMVMLGGQGTVLGPLIGAMGYQMMRSYLLTSDIFKNIQLTVAGVLLLLIILFIPAGAIGWLRNRFPFMRRYLI